jgi:hypothetical protein
LKIIKERDKIQFKKNVYIILDDCKKRNCFLSDKFKAEYYLKILPVDEVTAQEMILQYDCFITNTECLNKLTTLTNGKPIQIFQIQPDELKKLSIHSYMEKIWNWIVECETGVK